MAIFSAIIMTPSKHLLLSKKYLLPPIQCCMIGVKDFLKETTTLVGGRGVVNEGEGCNKPVLQK